MNDIRETLNERGRRYGDFEHHAELSDQLLAVMMATRGWQVMSAYQREATRMICHKLARIGNGDPFYDDSWRDIAGYAQLVVDILNQPQPQPCDTKQAFAEYPKGAISASLREHNEIKESIKAQFNNVKPFMDRDR